MHGRRQGRRLKTIEIVRLEWYEWKALQKEKAIPLNKEWYGLTVTKLINSVVLGTTRIVLACSSRPVQGGTVFSLNERRYVLVLLTIILIIVIVAKW
jgi:hypothetical protein